MDDSSRAQGVAVGTVGSAVRSTTGEEESTGQLVAGMAHDAKHLAEQCVALARIELEQGALGMMRMVTRVLIGSGLLLIGVLFLGIALGYASSAFTELPRWLTYGVLALGALGAGALVVAAKWLRPRAHGEGTRSDRAEDGA